jgi:hypothetical protein
MDAFDVSAEWLITGNGANVKLHLSRTAGNVAILPVAGERERERQRFWQPHAKRRHATPIGAVGRQTHTRNAAPSM